MECPEEETKEHMQRATTHGWYWICIELFWRKQRRRRGWPLCKEGIDWIELLWFLDCWHACQLAAAAARVCARTGEALCSMECSEENGTGVQLERTKLEMLLGCFLRHWHTLLLALAKE